MWWSNNMPVGQSRRIDFDMNFLLTWMLCEGGKVCSVFLQGSHGLERNYTWSCVSFSLWHGVNLTSLPWHCPCCFFNSINIGHLLLVSYRFVDWKLIYMKYIIIRYIRFRSFTLTAWLYNRACGQHGYCSFDLMVICGLRYYNFAWSHLYFLVVAALCSFLCWMCTSSIQYRAVWVNDDLRRL